MIKKLLVKYRELITYVIFGVLTTVVSLVSFKIFDSILGEGLYLVSNVISWIFAVSFAYVTNKLWVFESKSWKSNVIIKEIIGFVSARLFSLGVEELGLWLLIDIFSIGKISVDLFSFNINGNMIAKLIMQFVVIVLNYVFSKLVIFKKKNNNGENE